MVFFKQTYINFDKTNYNVFHSPRKKNCNILIHWKLEKAKMSRVNYVQVSILLEDHLNWKFHIRYLCNNLTKVICAFKLIKRLVPFQFKHQLYYADCFSQISYGIQIQCTCSKSYIRKIQIIKIESSKHYIIKTSIPILMLYTKNSVF